ncbi:hypothetical protein MBLNU13_g07020t1 [Cladosporium sp. NU13]
MHALYAIHAVLALATASVSAGLTPNANSQAIASAFKVTPAQVDQLLQTDDISTIDPQPWAKNLIAEGVNVTTWDKAAYESFLSLTKDNIKHEATSDDVLERRELNRDNALPVKQITFAINVGRIQRDADPGHRRKLLTCDSKTQAKCTRCAQSCSIVWVSSTTICAGAALAAEAASAGGLTPAVLTILTGCVGLASGSYWKCIDTCVG